MKKPEMVFHLLSVPDQLSKFSALCASEFYSPPHPGQCWVTTAYIIWGTCSDAHISCTTNKVKGCGGREVE